jgi:transposase-like protein
MGNTFSLSGEVWIPWKECSVMDERLRFVAWLLDGEAMSEVCRAFGISRKTGYKIFERYKEQGIAAGLHDWIAECAGNNRAWRIVAKRSGLELAVSD